MSVLATLYLSVALLSLMVSKGHDGHALVFTYPVTAIAFALFWPITILLLLPRMERITWKGRVIWERKVGPSKSDLERWGEALTKYYGNEEPLADKYIEELNRLEEPEKEEGESITECAQEHTRQYARHIYHLLGVMNDAGLLDRDGTYCFPDGDTWTAPPGTEPVERDIGEWAEAFRNYGPKAMLRAIRAHADRKPGHISGQLRTMLEVLDDKIRDACEACRGARGGEPGNENHMATRCLCDYCSADEQVTENVNVCPGCVREGHDDPYIRRPKATCIAHRPKPTPPVRTAGERS